jgi:hypothetical protein
MGRREKRSRRHRHDDDCDCNRLYDAKSVHGRNIGCFRDAEVITKVKYMKHFGLNDCERDRDLGGSCFRLNKYNLYWRNLA